jgi:4'-phosphopantetheinyl transferase
MVAPPGKRDQAFLEIWTRKEALVKALGGGLSIPLSLFSVALGQPDGNLLKRLDLSGESSSGWCVRSIPDVPHAIAAVALDAPDFEFEWLPAEMAVT